jgi:hypothetical protein
MSDCQRVYAFDAYSDLRAVCPVRLAQDRTALANHDVLSASACQRHHRRECGSGGVPIRHRATFPVWARFGSAAIRAMSVALRPYNPQHFENCSAIDYSDLPIVPGAIEGVASTGSGPRSLLLGRSRAQSIVALQNVTKSHNFVVTGACWAVPALHSNEAQTDIICSVQLKA